MKNTRSSTIKYHCVACKKPYASQRALSVHLAKLDYCMEYKGNNIFHQNSKHQSFQPSLDLNIHSGWISKITIHKWNIKLSNLKVDDKVGIILCIVIASIQKTGCNILLSKAKSSDNFHRNIAYVFELMLC